MGPTWIQRRNWKIRFKKGQNLKFLSSSIIVWTEVSLSWLGHVTDCWVWILRKPDCAEIPLHHQVTSRARFVRLDFSATEESWPETLSPGHSPTQPLRCVKFISRGVALSFLTITTCGVQMPRTMASNCIWETSKCPRPGLHCYTSQAMGQRCRLVLSACRVTISLQLCWQESSTQNLILPIARGRYAPGRWWGLCW